MHKILILKLISGLSLTYYLLFNVLFTFSSSVCQCMSLTFTLGVKYILDQGCVESVASEAPASGCKLQGVPQEQIN